MSRVLLLLLPLLLLTVQLASAGRSYPKNNNPRVIIVGAGVSGIMAAATLSKHGIDDFLILEATGRIGGRLQERHFEGYTVEIGANWVEGVGGDKENPIWTLANEYNLTLSFTDFGNVSANTYSQNGTYLPVSETQPRFDLADASADFSSSLSESLTAHKDEDISISTAQRLFGFVPTTPLDMAIDFFYYDFEIAEPPRVTSLRNVIPNPTFEYYGTDEYLVADSRGYVHLLHELAKDFLEHDSNGTITDTRLQLDKVVNSIEYTNETVTLTTEDGSTYTSNFVILSVSLGVLKSDLITYKPDLPYWKIKTIYQFDMSIYTKIFLKFPYTFWPTGNGTTFFLYADGKRGYYPFWQHLEKEYPGSNLIFVTVTDDESRRIEQQPEEVTIAEITEVIRKIFGDDKPAPDAILIPKWSQDRYTRGSYMNWPIGVTDIDFDLLKAPVGPLYFTGEHTSSPFNGYVHGAYLAGIATAETLIDCIEQGKCHEVTSDDLPWEDDDGSANASYTGGCKGACCHEVQKARDSVRRVYANAVNVLQRNVANKCNLAK